MVTPNSRAWVTHFMMCDVAFGVGPLIFGYQLVTSEDMVNNRVGDTRLKEFAWDTWHRQLTIISSI